MGTTRDINQKKSNRQTTTRSKDKEFKEVILNADPIVTAGLMFMSVPKIDSETCLC